MRPLVVLLGLVPSIALADGTADRDLLVEYRRLAGEAARAGNCDPARELAAQVRQLDPAFFANEYASDPAIAACLPPPSSPAAIAPIDATSQLAPPSSQPPVEPRPQVAYPTRPAIPELDGGRLVGEVLVGGLLGVAGLFVGAYVGASTCDNNTGDDEECLGPALLGAYLGGGISFGIGVGLAGRAGSQTGSMAAAVGGAALGSLVGVAALYAFEGNGLVGVTLIGGPVVGALVGFNLTRRWDDPSPVVGSLLTVRGGSLSLGVPMISHGERRGVATTTVPLLSGSF